MVRFLQNTTLFGKKTGEVHVLLMLFVSCTGFPRKMDQALKFEEAVCPSKFTLFFDCPESVMQERLLNRGKTSGRADDNEESIKKRFKTFVETSMPVVDYFDGQERVVKVSAVPSPDKVYEEVKKRFRERGVKMNGE
jgi:UMP-CMP kinase